jgi:hypothetical protein
MAIITTPKCLLDQERRRLTPPLNKLPGMGAVEKRLLDYPWKPKVLAELPVGSGRKPIVLHSPCGVQG